MCQTEGKFIFSAAKAQSSQQLNCTFLSAQLKHHLPISTHPGPSLHLSTHSLVVETRTMASQAAAQTAAKAINPAFNPRTVHFWV